MVYMFNQEVILLLIIRILYPWIFLISITLDCKAFPRLVLMIAVWAVLQAFPLCMKEIVTCTLIR